MDLASNYLPSLFGYQMPFSYQRLFSALAMALTFITMLPYLLATLKGIIRPHVFSWLIWALTTGIVFFAQWQAGGGAGAVAIGFSALLTCGIATAAYCRRGDMLITRMDWWFFLLALLSLPCWWLTQDPLYAVVLLTTVDLLGFGPTIRKAYWQPHSESLGFFAVFALRNLLVILAMQSWSLTTLLFPAAIAVVCLGISVMLAIRRRPASG